jgi:uncharacterized protein involved in response to NO
MAAPHRLGFAGGALWLGLAGLWWAGALLAASMGAALPWAVAPGLAHALLMGFASAPLFISGFLFTAGPRWLGVDGPGAHVLLVPVALQVSGWSVFVAGVHSDARLAGLGLAAVAAGWGLATLRFGALVQRSQRADRLHPALLLAGCAAGVSGLALAAGAVASGRVGLLRPLVHALLWCSLAQVFVVALHRMIPAFGGAGLPGEEPWGGKPGLTALVGLTALEAALAAAQAAGLPLPPPLLWTAVVLELIGAVLLGAIVGRWLVTGRWCIRLLAMLNIGFAWLALALALSAASHAARALGGPGLGLAPLHALGAGFVGSVMFAMVGRVSAGHGGRVVAADSWLWRLFLVLQAAVLLRLVSALWVSLQPTIAPWAAVAWGVAVLGWAGRYLHWYGTPRPDGRPG